MMDPRYQEITHDQIPTVTLRKGVTVRLICGSLQKLTGPVRDIVADPEFFDVSMDPGAVFYHKVKEGYTAFAYVIGGEGTFDPNEGYQMNNRDLVLFGNGEGVYARSSGRGFRFLFFSGKPIHEPVAWRGPVVMNTNRRGSAWHSRNMMKAHLSKSDLNDRIFFKGCRNERALIFLLHQTV